MQRISDNNAWARETTREHPELSYFCGVDAVLMAENVLLAEVEQRVANGALGVKIVPRDMQPGAVRPRTRRRPRPV